MGCFCPLNAAWRVMYCQWVKDCGLWMDIELGAARTMPVGATASAATNTDDSVTLSTVVADNVRSSATHQMFGHSSLILLFQNIQTKSALGSTRRYWSKKVIHPSQCEYSVVRSCHQSFFGPSRGPVVLSYPIDMSRAFTIALAWRSSIILRHGPNDQLASCWRIVATSAIGVISRRALRCVSSSSSSSTTTSLSSPSWWISGRCC
jgi:hypothetical protein